MSDPRTFYPLLTSRRPAIASVQLQLGQGNDLGELTYALKTLKRQIERSGYTRDLARSRILARRGRIKFKRVTARRRLAKTLSRAARREAARPDYC